VVSTRVWLLFLLAAPPALAGQPARPPEEVQHGVEVVRGRGVDRGADSLPGARPDGRAAPDPEAGTAGEAGEAGAGASVVEVEVIRGAAPATERTSRVPADADGLRPVPGRSGSATAPERSAWPARRAVPRRAAARARPAVPAAQPEQQAAPLDPGRIGRVDASRSAVDLERLGRPGSRTVVVVTSPG
jgi:hypothetical protein